MLGGDGIVYHYGTYKEEFPPVKRERNLAAVTPSPRERPTPTFISEVTGPKTEPEVTERGKYKYKPDSTIPWEDSVSSDKERETNGTMVPGKQRKDSVVENLNPHVHLIGLREVSHSHSHHHHCSPLPPPTCPATTHTPIYCGPALPPLHTRSPGGCRARSGVAKEPAMCGSAIVMFEQDFVDDHLCHVAVDCQAGELRCARCHRIKQ